MPTHFCLGFASETDFISRMPCNRLRNEPEGVPTAALVGHCRSIFKVKCCLFYSNSTAQVCQETSFFTETRKKEEWKPIFLTR